MAFAANATDFRIHGDVADVADGTVLYLRLVGPPEKDIDSVKILNGKFEFKGKATATPTWATLSIKGKFLPLTDLYLEEGDIYVYGKLYQCEAKGTRTNEEYLDFKHTLTPMYGEVYNIHGAVASKTVPSSQDSLNAGLKRYEEKLDKAELDYIRKYPASVISLQLLVYKSSHMSGAKTLQTISLLDTSLQKTQQVLNIKEYATRLIGCEEGTMAPDFSLETSTGTTFSLSEKRGKYILLDFWASWCAPCRNALPEVARLNEKYRGNKFEIIGVSVDRKTDKWKKALAEDGCSWTQVCDPTGKVANLYAVSAIPLMVIVSPDGKIMKRILNKEDLVDILDKIF